MSILVLVLLEGLLPAFIEFYWTDWSFSAFVAVSLVKHGLGMRLLWPWALPALFTLSTVYLRPCFEF